MAEKTKTYENDDLKIVWKPDLCIHSKKCWKGLLPVFDPRRRPWIDPAAASSEDIIAQIDQCPSGALSYKLKTNEAEEKIPDTVLCQVEVAQNGPLLVKGLIELKRADGSIEIKEKMTAFCRCGASKNKPFCDGSHRSIGFEG